MLTLTSVACADSSTEISETYTDSITLTLPVSFDEPGRYTVVFGASDNDNHVERLTLTVVVGEPPTWRVGARPQFSEWPR